MELGTWVLSPAWGWEWGAGVLQQGMRKQEEPQEHPKQMGVGKGN